MLSRLFFEQLVKPIVQDAIPSIPYAAARIGKGSEVLGLDDEISQDHDWGPRLQLFLKKKDFCKYESILNEKLKYDLPPSFEGFSTCWSDPDEFKTQVLTQTKENEVKHRVEIYTVDNFLKEECNIELKDDYSPIEWLNFREQALLEFTSGDVFHDDLGHLTKTRQKLAYYPDGVWKYRMVNEWAVLDDLKTFMGRAASRGDRVGAMIITTEQIKRLMSLGFMLERRYIPYEKWFGTCFSQLPIGKILTPLLDEILKEGDWVKRESLICDAGLQLLEKHNELTITEHIPIAKEKFYNREHTILDYPSIIKELKAQMQPPLDEIPPMHEIPLDFSSFV